jgi:thymidylate kinase/thymidylate synthase ThyX
VNTKNTTQGIFVVFEGTNGSGKTTQLKLLAKQLQQAGHDVVVFDFPQYGKSSGYFVKQYIEGEYGSADEIGPYTGSLFYSLDRFDAATAIRQALDEGKVVLANRFTGHNMAHQGTKFESPEQRRGYFIWLDNLEYDTLKIPRPDLNLVLRMPAETAQELSTQKDPTTAQAVDVQQLRQAIAVYDDLCQLFPKDFYRIDCVRSGKLLEIDVIGKLVSEKLHPLLPTPASQPGQGTISEAKVAPAPEPAVSEPLTPEPPTVPEPAPQPAPQTEPKDQQYVKKGRHGTAITDAGHQLLQQAVSNADGPVYTFHDTFSSQSIAAAMARLCRRGDDMRVTLLEEFAHAAGQDEQVLRRVITAYGDDSVQQLVGIPLVVEDASQLLTKKLEWGRLAAYLEQSTRYIYYDQKDAKGRYKYFTPGQFDPATTKAYRQAMDDIFNRYSVIVRKLTTYVRDQSSVPNDQRDKAWRNATRAQACDAARSVLPVATTSTVAMFISAQALEAMAIRLQADELPEARQAANHILQEARKVIPAFLERADKPERGGAASAYLGTTRQEMKHLADELLPVFHPDAADTPVTLTDVWPRNELDIVADMLYEHSDLPLGSLRDIVDGWSYNQKADVFLAYMGERLNRRHKPGRALEKIHYSWDLVCDYGIFRDLQRHRMVDDLEWQQLTPRHGYDMPKLVDDAGLGDLYEECFDLSLQLYSLLQREGYSNEAQYATLLGHRMRWKVTYNARQAFHIHELRTSPQGHPGYRKLVSQMHDKLTAVHPLLAQSMQFVNQGEDPELTRLAAERYTQFKLQQMQDKPSIDKS